ncbi:deoxyribonuclease IV [Paenibacillus sp. JSM ZJ436]|uniref:deoxyribonuclease IV n=1 Tax=Paenibacillus sp. JSM ZJ436 TaxID=3376190 RepID=UPI0037B9E57A
MNSTHTTPKVGGHVSTQGGYAAAARRALQMGGDAFQYFPKNPRRLHVKTPDFHDCLSCRAFCEEHGLVSVAHTPYPVNMAAGLSKGKEHYRLTVDCLINDLIIAEACGSLGIVVHFGHGSSQDQLTAYQNMIRCMNEVLREWNGQAKLLIENQAGDHGDMGITLEECVKVRELSSSPDQIGFCLDTCHWFASGQWQGENTAQLLKRGSELGYWESLALVHLNDSKYGAGSRKDRHERVGRGRIGKECLQSLLQSRELADKVFILETERGEDGTHRHDIAKVRSWLN